MTRITYKTNVCYSPTKSGLIRSDIHQYMILLFIDLFIYLFIYLCGHSK